MQTGCDRGRTLSRTWYLSANPLRVGPTGNSLPIAPQIPVDVGDYPLIVRLAGTFCRLRCRAGKDRQRLIPVYFLPKPAGPFGPLTLASFVEYEPSAFLNVVGIVQALIDNDRVETKAPVISRPEAQNVSRGIPPLDQMSNRSICRYPCRPVASKTWKCPALTSGGSMSPTAHATDGAISRSSSSSLATKIGNTG